MQSHNEVCISEAGYLMEPHEQARGTSMFLAESAEAYPPAPTCPPNKFFGRRGLRRSTLFAFVHG